MTPAPRRMSDGTSPWHIITCEYPPQVGGVADFVFGIARRLAEPAIPVHIWAPASVGDPPDIDHVVVHRTLGTFTPGDCWRTGRLLNQSGPARLFLQWVPHGYGYKSLNIPFAVWLAWRVAMRRDELHLMVHEPYMRVSWPPAHVAAAAVQKLMLWLLGHTATHVWLSTDGWTRWVRPFVRRGTCITTLPVSSPVEPEGDDPTVHGDRPSHTPLIVGHFSTYSPVVTVLLEPALVTLLEGSDVHVRLIGRGSEGFAARFTSKHASFADRVRGVGTRSAASLPEELRGCAFMLQPYPDGITARNTSALAALAYGLPIVSNAGPLTEPFWTGTGAAMLASAPDSTLLAEHALTASRDADLRARVGRAGALLYANRFSRNHAASLLTDAVRHVHSATAVRLDSNVQA